MENLVCSVRLMRQDDVSQITGIDRESFPGMYPPVNYEREMGNHLAHYIVGYEEVERMEELEELGELGEESSPPEAAGSGGFAFRVRELFNRNSFLRKKVTDTDKQEIVGFAGFWVVAQEAHVISIAVKESRRREGIGELLFISIIDLALELKAHILSLEARVSNSTAQSLYAKYGLIQTGLRRNYYMDDKEDAVIMTAENITSAQYQAQLQRLKQAHSRRWGIALYQIAR
ncbi:ribosomal protein S18-alanine N-acetyltransferase [Chloroflexota bacterium]